MNLREWVLAHGAHPHTAYRWYRQGKLPVPACKMGELIPVGDLAASTKATPCGVPRLTDSGWHRAGLAPSR